MATVGKRTNDMLETVHPQLDSMVRQALIAAPAWLDFAVISGNRTAEEQRELFNKGRDEAGQIIDQSKVVTYKDGFTRKSNHQGGDAVDIVAYKNGEITWDRKEIAIRSAYVIGFAAARGVRLSGGVKWGWDEGHIERVTS